MQKKVIALAVAALASGAAMAQSNVTVYGWIDAAVQTINTNNAAAGTVKNYRGVDDGQYGSRLGFKGEEGLGGGLKAFFDLEYGINPANSVGALNSNSTSANLNTRHSLVGLSDNALGTLAVGRIETAARSFAIATRPWGGVADTHRMLGEKVLGMGINSADRLSNAVSYTSPTFAGFTAIVQHSSDKGDTAFNDLSYNQTGAGRQPVSIVHGQYTLGGLDVAAIWRRQQNQLQGATESANSEAGIRAAYDFKVVKIGASYNQIRKNTVSSNFDKGYLWGVFANVPVGDRVNLSAQYNQSKATNLAANNAGDIGGKAFALNASYDFSKRTQLYTQYANYKLNNGNASLSSPNVGFNGWGQIGVEPGKTVNAFSVGMLHKF